MPNLGFYFGFFDQTLSLKHTLREGFIFCYAYKWEHEKTVKADSIHFYKRYKKNPYCDKKITKSVFKLLDEADIVVAQNGKKFDMKWLNKAFLKHIGHPPSPFKVIDTYEQSKANFYENTHNLNDLSIRYGLGKKIDTGGIELWRRCYNGDLKAGNLMVKYCKEDTRLLEKRYFHIKPFIKNHPNLSIYEESPVFACPSCNSKKYKRSGYSYTNTGKRQRYQCRDCNKWFKGGKNLVKGVSTSA